MVQLQTLVGIAGAGGVIIASTNFVLQRILQNRVLESPVYKETMEIINNNPGVEKLLGKPVKAKKIDVTNPNNILSLKTSTLELPVYGPKTNGVLYVSADRISKDDSWNIFRLELEVLDKLGGKISIINKSPVLLKAGISGKM